MSMRALFPLAALLAISCAGGDTKDDTATAEADADTDADSDADTDADSDADSDVDSNAVLVGSAVDAGGNPVSGLRMQLCYHVCRTAESGADGSFRFEGVEGATHSLQAVTPGDTSVAVPTGLVTLGADETRTLPAPMVVVPFDTRRDITAAGAVTSGLLTVDADPAGFTEGLYTTDYGEVYFASVSVDPSTAGVPLDTLEGTPVAMFHLGNYDGVLSPPWPFQVEGTFGLTAGQTVEIFAVDNATKLWASGGTATVTETGIESTVGAGIPFLTTLVLVPTGT